MSWFLSLGNSFPQRDPPHPLHLGSLQHLTLISFPGLGCLEGQTLDQSCQELRDKFWEFYKVGRSSQAPPMFILHFLTSVWPHPLLHCAFSHRLTGACGLLHSW